MIPEDRALLQRLMNVNTNLGNAVVALLDHQNGNGMTPDAMRALAGEMQHVVTDLQHLATTRENTIHHHTPQVIVMPTDRTDGAGT